MVCPCSTRVMRGRHWLKFKLLCCFSWSFTFVSEGGCDLFCMEMEGVSVAFPLFECVCSVASKRGDIKRCP